MDFWHIVNTALWVLGNLVSLLIFVSAMVFAVAYPILFRVGETTAGKLIWRAIFSVGGFGLLAVIGTFVDGRVNWTQIPPDVEWWRPLVRIVVYGLIFYTYASLVALLVLRRFFPRRITVAPEPLAALTAQIRSIQGSSQQTWSTGGDQAAKIAHGLIERGWTHPLLTPSDTLNVHPRSLRRP